jgi:replicative DNA helicase
MEITNRQQNALLETGKMPPIDLDTEEVVLGQIMLEAEAVFQVLDILKPESFYKKSHQKIFRAAQELAKNEEPVNLITVSEQLRRMGVLEEVGGRYAISQLTSRASSAAHIEFHAKLVAQKFIQRELIRISSDIQERAFDPGADVADLLDFSERELYKVAEGNIKKESIQAGLLIPEALRLIEEAGKKEDGLTGKPSGFTDLDRVTNGWQAANMIVIAARPAMGKTAFILSMLRNMAVDHNVPVALFSLEMNSLMLVNRLIVSESELPHEKIRKGRLNGTEWKILEEKTRGLLNAPIYLDDTPALSIFDFRAKCRRLKQKYDIQAVFIDYLQLMSSNGSFSREQEVSSISRQIKSVAMELNIPVIALSQLSRAVETRGGNKKPQLSDLRESGAIEQDADMVMFIHRPEYYGLTEDEEGHSLINKAEIIIAKNRHGATDTIRLKFTKELAKFTDDTSAADIDISDDVDIESMALTFSSKMNSESSQHRNEIAAPKKDMADPFDDVASNFNFDADKPAPF